MSGAEPSALDLPPAPLRGERVLVLGFDPQVLALNHVQADAVCLVADRPCAGVEAEERVSWRDLKGPFGSARVRAFGPTCAVVSTLQSARPEGVLAAIRHGVDRFLLVDAPGSSFPVNGRGALILVTRRALARGLARVPLMPRLERRLGFRLDPPWPSLEDSVAAAEALAEHARAALPLSSRSSQRVVHYIASLYPGGAERQLTYLARESRALGHEVAVWTAHETSGDSGHYAADLAAAGVALSQVPQASPLRPEVLSEVGVPREVVRLLERHMLAPYLFGLVERLRQEPPDVLHCWLDQPNLIGALAGLAAGVPRILISTRNLSPRYLPRLNAPWLSQTYAALLRSERVVCLGNSAAGARDYAEWTGSDPARWRVVRNGFEVEACRPLPPEERARERAAEGLAPEDLLVIGVFRLAEEKRPHDFLDLIERARRELPRLVVWHVGSGELTAEVEAAARARGLLDGTLRFLGRRDDPWRLISLADVSVLTSEVEGCPNVALESMALEVPMVVTDGGGTAEVVAEGQTGYVRPVGDVAGLCERLVELGRDPALRERFGRAGRALIAERFGMERMVAESLALYRA